MSNPYPRKILYLQYTNPGAGYPSLEHSSRILASLGWQVLFLGTGAFGAADTLRFPPHSNIVVRQLSFCPGGWRQKLHYLWFFLWVMGWTLQWRPSWVYASDLLSCPAGMLLSFIPGLRVIYHEHDSPNPPYSSFIRFALWTRRIVARRAQMCVLPNERRAERFALEMGKGRKILTVWNCPAKDEISYSARSPYRGGDFWILYHGSIVPPRLPMTVLQALALLPDRVKLRVIGYDTIGYPKYVEELQEMSSRLALRDRVDFMGALPTRKELFEYCRRCDVGLAFMPKKSLDLNEQTMSEASNKPFDYLANGLAVLVSNLPDWTELYVEPGYGLVCDPDDPKSVADALAWFLDHPKEMREMGEQGRQRILKEWNYEQQFLPVFERLKAVA